MSAVQQALLSRKPPAASFTPADLSPLAWFDATGNATYSGGNLATAGNAGSVGGSFSITGTIGSTTSGSLTLATFNATSKRLNLTFAIATGRLTVWYAGKLTATGGVNGIFAYDWPGGGNAKAVYANVGSADLYGFANGCCDPAVAAPAFYSAAGGVNDTNFHTMVWTMGTSNVLYRDGSSQTLTTQSTGAMPSTGSLSWDFGIADRTGEPANASIATIMVTNTLPTSGNVSDFHTYYSSRA